MGSSWAWKIKEKDMKCNKCGHSFIYKRCSCCSDKAIFIINLDGANKKSGDMYLCDHCFGALRRGVNKVWDDLDDKT